MIGKYKGYFKYDKQELQEQIKHNQTYFNIEITNFENDKFHGIVEDEVGTGGAIGKGTIKGEKKGDKIFFIKEMPTATFFKNGEIKTYKRKHPKIYYSGIISENIIEGVWKIKFNIMINGLMILLGATTTGTWQMKKITTA